MAMPKREPTKVIRVPVALEQTIKDMIKEHRASIGVTPVHDKACIVRRSSNGQLTVRTNVKVNKERDVVK